MGKGGARGFSPCQLWVVADEIGKGGARGFSPCRLWVVADETGKGVVGCRRLCWLVLGWVREREARMGEFGLEGKGRRWR
jgi:hypothetical protein